MIDECTKRIHLTVGEPGLFRTDFLDDQSLSRTRLPLGSDTVERIKAKHAHVEKELAEWRSVATSTDWTDEAA